MVLKRDTLVNKMYLSAENAIVALISFSSQDTSDVNSRSNAAINVRFSSINFLRRIITLRVHFFVCLVSFAAVFFVDFFGCE